MFKHSSSSAAPKSEDKSTPKEAVVLPTPKDTSPGALRDLLEKNLKWSQIIYEQNRKLNNKLIWAAIAGWLRLALIVMPLIAAIIFLPTLLKSFMSNYGDLFRSSGGGQGATSSLQKLLELLPINSPERDQLKTILK